jgi:hypothetical protein
VQQILKAAVQKGEKEKYSINIYFVYLREACTSHPWGILQIALQCTVPTLQVKSLSFWSLSMIEAQYSGGDHRQLELSFESMGLLLDSGASFPSMFCC